MKEKENQRFQMLSEFCIYILEFAYRLYDNQTESKYRWNNNKLC